jgi:hypothetical protein
MRKLILPLVFLCALTITAPAHAFFDYLFGGAASRDAIDNSVIGDVRAWWTGNPAYTFNPYYSPQQQNPLQSQAPQRQQMGAPQVQPPNMTFNPPQGSQQPYYGQPDPNEQAMPQQYSYQQQYQQTPQAYQQVIPQQQQYQQAPRQYQAAPQQQYLPPGQAPMQYQPQAYQQQMPQQYQAAPGGYR